MTCDFIFDQSKWQVPTQLLETKQLVATCRISDMFLLSTHHKWKTTMLVEEPMSSPKAVCSVFHVMCSVGGLSQSGRASSNASSSSRQARARTAMSERPGGGTDGSGEASVRSSGRSPGSRSWGGLGWFQGAAFCKRLFQEGV